MIEQISVKTNGYFGILEEPVNHKQHPNQQKGLDMYIKVVNFDTGEICFKKLYQNTIGLHFKHSGSGVGSHYLDDFTMNAIYVPFQIIMEDK